MRKLNKSKIRSFFELIMNTTCTSNECKFDYERIRNILSDAADQHTELVSDIWKNQLLYDDSKTINNIFFHNDEPSTQLSSIQKTQFDATITKSSGGSGIRRQAHAEEERRKRADRNALISKLELPIFPVSLPFNFHETVQNGVRTQKKSACYSTKNDTSKITEYNHSSSCQPPNHHKRELPCHLLKKSFPTFQNSFHKSSTSNVKDKINYRKKVLTNRNKGQVEPNSKRFAKNCRRYPKESNSITSKNQYYQNKVRGGVKPLLSASYANCKKDIKTTGKENSASPSSSKRQKTKQKSQSQMKIKAPTLLKQCIDIQYDDEVSELEMNDINSCENDSELIPLQERSDNIMRSNTFPLSKEQTYSEQLITNDNCLKKGNFVTNTCECKNILLSKLDKIYSCQQTLNLPVSQLQVPTMQVLEKLSETQNLIAENIVKISNFVEKTPPHLVSSHAKQEKCGEVKSPCTSTFVNFNESKDSSKYIAGSTILLDETSISEEYSSITNNIQHNRSQHSNIAKNTSPDSTIAIRSKYISGSTAMLNENYLSGEYSPKAYDIQRKRFQHGNKAMKPSTDSTITTTIFNEKPEEYSQTNNREQQQFQQSNKIKNTSPEGSTVSTMMLNEKSRSEEYSSKAYFINQNRFNKSNEMKKTSQDNSTTINSKCTSGSAMISEETSLSEEYSSIVNDMQQINKRKKVSPDSTNSISLTDMSTIVSDEKSLLEGHSSKVSNLQQKRSQQKNKQKQMNPQSSEIIESANNNPKTELQPFSSGVNETGDTILFYGDKEQNSLFNSAINGMEELANESLKIKKKDLESKDSVGIAKSSSLKSLNGIKTGTDIITIVTKGQSFEMGRNIFLNEKKDKKLGDMDNIVQNVVYSNASHRDLISQSDERNDDSKATLSLESSLSHNGKQIKDRLKKMQTDMEGLMISIGTYRDEKFSKEDQTKSEVKIPEMVQFVEPREKYVQSCESHQNRMISNEPQIVSIQNMTKTNNLSQSNSNKIVDTRLDFVSAVSCNPYSNNRLDDVNGEAKKSFIDLNYDSTMIRKKQENHISCKRDELRNEVNSNARIDKCQDNDSQSHLNSDIISTHLNIGQVSVRKESKMFESPDIVKEKLCKKHEEKKQRMETDINMTTEKRSVKDDENQLSPGSVSPKTAASLETCVTYNNNNDDPSTEHIKDFSPTTRNSVYFWEDDDLLDLQSCMVSVDFKNFAIDAKTNSFRLLRPYVSNDDKINS